MPNNDDALREYDFKIEREGFFKSLGMNERAATKAAAGEKDVFDYRGGRLTFKAGDPDLPASKDPKAIAFFTGGGTGAIYKIDAPKDQETETLSDADAAALIATVTGRGKLVRAIGEKAATALVTKAGFKSLADFKTPSVGADGKRSRSPWSAEAWNITEQGRVTKALGVEKASAMAAAQGVTVGALRPRAKA